MKEKKIKLFPYSGNKLWFTDKFNDIVLSKLGKNPDIIVEPFCGSAAISMNSKAKQIYINDYDKNIYLMLYTIHNTSYETYSQIVNEVEQFGNIKTTKEYYYNFRDNWNNTYYKNICKTDLYKTNTKAGLYLLILAGACINSMLRFSDNGMNQSWGNRFYKIDKDSYNKLSYNNTVTITNYDFYSDTYQEFINTLPKNSVIFLDPPYEFREMTYNKGFSVNKFIDTIKSKDFAKNSLVMYTDIENDVSDNLLNYGYEKYIIREMKSTSPNRKNENKTGNEVLYIRK